AEHDEDQTQPHGGKIAFGIQEMTALAKDELITIVEAELKGAGSTPLCESYYEAYRYLAGLPLGYGNQDLDINQHDKDSPPRDESSITEEGGVYQSPYAGCSNEIFVILITDGVPQRDNAADEAIIALQATDNDSTASSIEVTDANGNVTINYLPMLAEYMHNNDINTDMDGKQIATLSTVGFSSGANDARNLLESAA
ncbi:MAG: hypothetical protein ABJH08_13675, partial [Balneola sp.]